MAPNELTVLTLNDNELHLAVRLQSRRPEDRAWRHSLGAKARRLDAPLATYRQEGILRRLATTPAPRSWVLAAPVLVNLGLAIAGFVVIFVAGHLAFGLPSPRRLGALALTLGLCIAALFAAIAAVAHVCGLQLISAAIFLPLVFFAGLWIPRQEMPWRLFTGRSARR